jgi:rhodanese-related sulfurtransferase
MDFFRSKAARIVALYCGLLVNGSAGAVVIDIDNAELAKLLATGVPLIDIRTSPEWKQTGIVQGSHLLTFFDEQGQADPATWLESARSIAKPTDPVIVICRTGNRTKEMSKFLSDEAGYAIVYNAKDGIASWGRDGRTLIPLSQHMASCRAAKTC